MGEEKQGSITPWDVVPGLDFIDEIDIPEFHSWFFDGTHSIPPWTPLYGWYWIRYCPHGTKAAAEKLSIPTCKGWEMRFRNGGSYNAWHVVKDEKERAEREVKFREALRPWMEDFDSLWEVGKQELLGLYSKLLEVDLDNISSLQLFNYHYDMMAAYQRMWEVHFDGMYAAFMAWLLLEDLCKERFGIKDTNTEFQDMLRGYDNKIYQMEKRLWEFGKEADGAGLGDIFKESAPVEIIPKLEQTAKGKEWFQQFMTYLETDEVGGWRMRRMCDFNEPYWMEDPATPMAMIKDYVERGVDFSLDDTRGELEKKRKAAIAAFLQKVPQDEKALFEGLIRLAGQASSYSEEHNLYCELMSQAVLRRGYLAMGRRFAQKGTIDQPEDIFMLNPEEVERAIMVPESYDMRWLTRRRRTAWEEWHKLEQPPVITDRGGLEEAVGQDLIPAGDVIALKVVVGEMPEPKPELEADLFGICGSGGEIEGIARVAVNYEDLKRVQPGDILVCPATNPAWTPAFGVAAGVVTDRGGTLSHAAIIGREYGLPVIVNTFEGTAKIRDGQRIRINADKGAVFIVDK